MRISYWSSDVCSSDLVAVEPGVGLGVVEVAHPLGGGQVRRGALGEHHREHQRREQPADRAGDREATIHQVADSPGVASPDGFWPGSRWTRSTRRWMAMAASRWA